MDTHRPRRILFALLLLSSVSILAAQAAPPAGDETPGATPATAMAPPDALSPAEIEQIRSQVLRRCGLSAKIKQNKLPWYFHYEFGVELLSEGAGNQALESLQLSANLKPESARDKRMYGMWFVNYVPYYQLSQAYAQADDWENAWAAISMSELYLELAPGDSEYENFTNLKTEVFDHRESATTH